MPHFDAARAADLHRELLDGYEVRDELLEQTKDRVTQWKFTNLAPDPVSPPGILESIDFDLHMTDGFVRPATRWKSKATDRCCCQVGFDKQGRQILEEGGSPLIWEYRDAEILEYNLSGAESRIRLRKRPLSDGGPAQLHIDANAVLSRFVLQSSPTQLHITSERWAKSDNGFTLDISCTFEHFITFDSSGIERIETDTLLDGVKANREVSWQRRGLFTRLADRFRRTD